jgi:hypothetical protein
MDNNKSPFEKYFPFSKEVQELNHEKIELYRPANGYKKPNVLLPGLRFFE